MTSPRSLPPQVLSQALGGCAVYALDLPGVGTESDVPAPRSIAATADHVRLRWQALCADKGVTHPVAVMGVSMGGMVALDWVSRHPEDFSHVVCARSSGWLHKCAAAAAESLSVCFASAPPPRLS